MNYTDYDDFLITVGKMLYKVGMFYECQNFEAFIDHFEEELDALFWDEVDIE